MPKADAGGAVLHYERLGTGPDVVLLHGLTTDAGFWYPAIALDLSVDHTLTLVDLPGHGRSSVPRSGYSTRAVAHRVLALLDRLGLARVRLVGHSYGGAVALHGALTAPERVAAVVVADTRLRALQPVAAPTASDGWDEVRGRLAARGVPLDGVSELTVLEALARLRLAGALDAALVAPFVVPFAHGGLRAARRWLRLMHETTARDELTDVAGLTVDALARLACPLLALYGERSHCLPSGERLARLVPAGRLVRVEGVGHFHPLRRPDVFCAETRRFLAEVDARPVPAPTGGGRDR